MKFIVDKKNFGRLKDFGFKLPDEWLTSVAFEGTNMTNECMIDNCYYAFLMDSENPSRISVDDYGNPLLMGWVDTRPEEYGVLWFDAIPFCTYHVEMNDLEMMMDIIYSMTREGILKKMNKKRRMN